MASVTFDLMDVSSGNLVGSYSDEAAALRDVRASIERYGEESILTLALARSGPGDGELLATGADLARLALERGAPDRRRSA